jgi:hypothetical protein
MRGKGAGQKGIAFAEKTGYNTNKNKNFVKSTKGD